MLFTLLPHMVTVLGPAAASQLHQAPAVSGLVFRKASHFLTKEFGISIIAPDRNDALYSRLPQQQHSHYGTLSSSKNHHRRRIFDYIFFAPSKAKVKTKSGATFVHLPANERVA